MTKTFLPFHFFGDNRDQGYHFQRRNYHTKWHTKVIYHLRCGLDARLFDRKPFGNRVMFNQTIRTVNHFTGEQVSPYIIHSADYIFI